MTDLELIEKALYGYIPEGLTYEKKLVESMAYSLKAGGKRIRPMLTLEFSRICGGEDSSALPFGMRTSSQLYTHVFWLSLGYTHSLNNG